MKEINSIPIIKTLKTIAFWFLAVSLTLTCLAWFLKNVHLMSFIGFLLFNIILLPVILTNSITENIKSFLQKYNRGNELLSLYRDSFLESFSSLFPVFFRSSLQAIAFWIVTLFSELCTFNIANLKSLDLSDFMASIFLLILGVAGQFFPKENYRAKFEWYSNVSGNISFFRGFFLLIYGILIGDKYSLIFSFFNDPLWFLDPLFRSHILRYTGLIASFFIAILSIYMIYHSILVILDKKTGKDKRELMWGLFFTLVWIFSIPLVWLYSIIIFASKS